MRVLIVGAGARQHALAWRLGYEPGIEAVVCAPGNPLMADVAHLHPEMDGGDPDAIVRVARAERVDLVVVGPEDPLVAGVADRLADAGIACFGPSAAAAQLEASKSFAREVCMAAGVRMARGRAFDDAAAAMDFLEELDGPAVIKADGLALGKGVTVCDTAQEAQRAIAEALVEDRFGAAGRRVVVEDRLIGREASLFAMCDGSSYVLLPAARDHKRLGENDTGPNTGGMGAYSPVDEVDDERLLALGEDIVAPVLTEMAARGTPFRGVLFAGLMLTADGPRVLEFNIRLGDPETQAILPRVDAVLSPLMLECATGRLTARGVLPTSAEATVAVCLAAAGYPDTSRRGDPILGLDDARADGTLVFGAGVARDADGRLVTAGGRVVTVVGRGADLAEAADRAYVAADRISYGGKFMRRDIGRSLVAGGA